MGRRGDHSFHELNDMIINAACDILKTEGYNKLSTRKIASQIGYTVGTLYNIFQNLDDIFIHINSRTLDILIERIDKAIHLDNGISPIKNLANAYIAFSQENLQYWSMLFEHQFPEDQVFPRWYKQKVERLYEIVGEAMYKSVDKIEQEKLKEYVSVLWAGIHGINILMLKGKFARAGVTSSEVLVDNFVDNYLNGISAFR